MVDRVEVDVVPEYKQAFTAERKKAPWEPPNTLPTDGELEEEFRWLVNPILGEHRTTSIIEMIRNFDHMEDAAQLIQACLNKSSEC